MSGGSAAFGDQLEMIWFTSSGLTFRKSGLNLGAEFCGETTNFVTDDAGPDNCVRHKREASKGIQILNYG